MTDEQTEQTPQSQEAGDDRSAAERAQKVQRESDEAKEEVKRLEEEPPERLEDWPEGKAKYETFGGPEHETSYEEAATAKLGPSDVRFHEDGTVEVDGEEADDPDEFKGDPIPGGPTDPNAPGISGEDREEREEQQEGDSQEDDGEKD